MSVYEKPTREQVEDAASKYSYRARKDTIMGELTLKVTKDQSGTLPSPEMHKIRLYGLPEMAHYICTRCGYKMTRRLNPKNTGAYCHYNNNGKPCPKCRGSVTYESAVNHKDCIRVPKGYGYDVAGRLRRLCARFVQIPVEMWGKDHWSTFAYIETRIVDYKGVANPQHMRNTCHGAGIPTARRGDKEYPTRLKGQGGASSIDLYGHDDWSCCKDAEAEGLLIWNGTGVNPVFKLTDSGREVAAKLRQHKQDGGMFHHFEWSHANDVS